jgi:hypothetical protein
MGRVLRDNFDRLARFAATNDTVVVAGFEGQEFSNEVLSWHHINGIEGENVLPAIMITDMHPQRFAELNELPMHREGRFLRSRNERQHDRLILIPLRMVCTSATDVADLIDGLAQDIRSKTSIGGLVVDKRLKAGEDGALVDAIVLRRRGFDAWRRG